MHFSLSELWQSTGPFAKGIVVVMLLMSAVSVFVTCERMVVFFRSRKASKQYAARVASSLSRGQLTSAVSDKTDVGYLGRVLEAGIGAFQASPNKNHQYTVESVARALERQAQVELQELRRGQGVLGTVSSTAPFIGLLGTVMGIVTAFEQMAASGTGGLASVSAGIAEALITTAIGLLVAIPAVFAFNYLQGWVDARAVDISASSNELIDFVARRMAGGERLGLVTPVMADSGSQV